MQTLDIHERYFWALQLMDIQPGDRGLEIGCGAGIAAGLVAGKLQTGTLTAIDRSAPMVQKASARNRSYIEDSRLYVFHQPPSEAKTRPIAEATRRLFKAHGYAVQETRYQPMKPATASCILARPASWKELTAMFPGAPA